MSLKVLAQAARPKTLPASLFPTLAGILLAYSQDSFNFAVAAATLSCALSLQVLTNLANDYYDFKKGADTSDRIGPKRVMVSGMLSSTLMRQAILINVFICFLLGVYLVVVGGLPILVIGVLSIFFAIAYTAGPFPLAYLGLGEVFSFLFFGIIATTGSYYLQTKIFHSSTFAVGSLFGFLSVALISANNIRDIVADTKAHKKTIVVRFGVNFGKSIFVNSILLSIVSIPVFYYLGYIPWSSHICFALLPYALQIVRKMKSATSSEIVTIFPMIAKYYLFYGCLFSASLIVATHWLN